MKNVSGYNRILCSIQDCENDAIVITRHNYLCDQHKNEILGEDKKEVIKYEK